MLNAAMACMLSLILGAPVTPVRGPSFSNLDAHQAEVLVEAQKASKELEWRVFSKRVGDRVQTVVLLGEIHLARPTDVAIARTVFDQFKNFATENGRTSDEPSWDYRTGRLASVLVTPSLLAMIYFGERKIDSPMNHARESTRERSVPSRIVHNAERDHVPVWTEEVALLLMAGKSLIPFLLHVPIALLLLRSLGRGSHSRNLRKFTNSYVLMAGFVVGGIAFNSVTGDPLLYNRDVSMVQYIDGWVKRAPPGEGPLVVIVGRAHLKNMSEFLTKLHGYSELPVDETLIPLPATRGLPEARPL